MNRGESSPLLLRARRFGRFEGALASHFAIELRDLAVRETIHRMALDASQTDECLTGCVLVAGLEPNSLTLSPQRLAKGASLWKSRP
jgi:acetyl-CoA acetyltransferase